MGHKRTLESGTEMSASPLSADILRVRLNVRMLGAGHPLGTSSSTGLAERRRVLDWMSALRCPEQTLSYGENEHEDRSRVEQQDDHRAADGASRPHRVRPHMPFARPSLSALFRAL